MQENPLERVLCALANGMRVIVIRGAAGTGKTTLVRSLVPALKARGLDVALMAPTGRAAMVLGKRTGCESRTIHSHIYNVNDEPIKNEEGDALKFIFPLKHGCGNDVENTAFIVDEASMVGLAKHDNDRELFQFGSGSLLLDLIDYIGLKVPNTTNILIFVGDPFQLPPVCENCSTPPALDETKLQELIGLPPCVVELTTVHRQTQGSGILAEATKLRISLEHKDFNRCRFTTHDDLTIEDAENFLDSLDPQHDLNDKIVIAHTNRRVNELNCLIRRRLGYTALNPMQGERLLVIRNARTVTPAGAINQFYNGEFVTVEKEHGKECKLDGFYTPKDKHRTYHFTFVWRKMDLKWIYDQERSVCKEVWVNVSPIVTKEWEEDEPYAPIALYNGVKAAIEKNLRDKGRWSHEAVKEMLQQSVLLHAPVVKYGYAVTGHKSQGGEWKHVWVDYTFGPNVHTEFFFRWAYTATTRAKEHLHALYPPAIDSLANVFGNTPVNAPIAVCANSQSRGQPRDTIVGFLASRGLAVSEIKPMQWKYRLFINDISDTSRFGHVDVMYRKNNLVSAIDVRLDGDATIQADIAACFMGRPIQSVIPECRSNTSAAETADPLAGLNDHMRKIAERVGSAAKVVGLELEQAIEITSHQLRLVFSHGILDLYFDKKGQLTSVGTNTLNREDFLKLKELFGEGKAAKMKE